MLVDTAGEALLAPSREGVSELCRVAYFWTEVDVVLVLRKPEKEYADFDNDSIGSSSSIIGSSLIFLSRSSSASSCEEFGLDSWVNAESFDEPDPLACPFEEGGSG